MAVVLLVKCSARDSHFLPSGPINGIGAGQILHQPIILLVQRLNNNGDVDMTGYCIFIFSNFLQNEILVICYYCRYSKS